MRISVYLPLLLSAALAGHAPLAARRMRPAAAARALTVSACLAALASTWGLALLALSLLGHTPFARERIGALDPVPAWVALLALVLLAAGVLRAGRASRTRRQTEQALRAVCELCGARSELAVLDESALHAYAVPGRPGQPGRILVSSGLLRATSPTERRVVLAHERAHLRHGHHRYRALTELAAGLNPLLVPSRTAVAYLVERWADEAAAEEVGSRHVTGQTLARVALRTATRAAPGAALAFHRHAVPQRVRALQAPPTPTRRLLAAAGLGIAALTLSCAADATLAFSRLTRAVLGL